MDGPQTGPDSRHLSISDIPLSDRHPDGDHGDRHPIAVTLRSPSDRRLRIPDGDPMAIQSEMHSNRFPIIYE